MNYCVLTLRNQPSPCATVWVSCPVAPLMRKTPVLLLSRQEVNGSQVEQQHMEDYFYAGNTSHLMSVNSRGDVDNRKRARGILLFDVTFYQVNGGEMERSVHLQRGGRRRKRSVGEKRMII